MSAGEGGGKYCVIFCIAVGLLLLYTFLNYKINIIMKRKIKLQWSNIVEDPGGSMSLGSWIT
jgi:hypothetical protein